MNDKVDNKIKRKKKKLMIITLIFLLTIFLVVVTQTPFFNLKNIEIIGNKEINKDKILASSGIINGENIFKINIKNAKNNLKLHPYIEDIKIQRKFPNKIIINIHEKEEIAVIEYMNFYTYISYDGLILDVKADKKDNKTPIVKGLSIKDPSIGDKIYYNKKEQSDKISSFLEAYSKSQLKKQTSVLTFQDNLNINIKLNDDVEVAFGTLNKVKYKIGFLAETLNDLKKKNIKAKNIYLNKGDDIIVDIDNSWREINEK